VFADNVKSDKPKPTAPVQRTLAQTRHLVLTETKFYKCNVLSAQLALSPRQRKESERKAKK
jgi:hypothetical protein